MENNILILETENLAQLDKLNLSLYSQVMVTTSSSDGLMPIQITKQLLSVQQQHHLNIQLLVNSASSPVQHIFWAWSLGKLTITSPDAQITILTSNSQLQSLVDTCAEYQLSLQLLQVSSVAEKKQEESVNTVSMALLQSEHIHNSTPEKVATESNENMISLVTVPKIVTEPKEAPASAVITATSPTENTFTDIHAVEPTETRSEIAEMIREKEDRKRKNEQMINALMKKVSEFPYKIVESKPTSSLMKEQVIDPSQQILVG